MPRTKSAARRGSSRGEEPETSSRTPSPPAPPQARAPRAAPRHAEPQPNEMGFFYRDNVQIERYGRLLPRSCKCTRGVDWAFFEEVGLRNEFRVYLRDLGLRKLSDMREDTYRNLTLEFLSSVDQVRRANTELPWGTLKFRLRNVERHLTPGEFGRIFEVSHVGSAEIDREFSADLMWSQLIGNTEVFQKEGNASRMQNPRDRMLHAFLACTLTSRGSSTHKVSKEDLFLLWCYQENHPVNAAGWIMNRIYKTALKDKGDIMVGGYVTRIARHFGLAPTDEDEEFRIPYVDQQHGIGAKVLLGSRVIRRLPEPDRYGRLQYTVVEAGGSSAGAGQAQAQEEQRPTAAATRRRTRAGSRRQDAEGEPSLTDMMANMMQNMATGFADIRTHMDGRFQRLDDRLGRIEERLDAFMPPGSAPHPPTGPYPLALEFDPANVDMYTDD